MRIAFYAPMKAPDWPTASGDRTIARAFISALELAGHEVAIASRLRSFDGAGSPDRQAGIAARAEVLTAGLIARYQREAQPDLWFTYHLFHKAPDLIGPQVARALAIPYVVAEASFSPRRADGPWQTGHASVADTLATAALVISLNRRDQPALAARPGLQSKMVHLPVFRDLSPFVDAATHRSENREKIARNQKLNVTEPWLVTAAMMRPGDKTQSYLQLAEALAQLIDRPWRLLIAGDGASAPAIHAAFAPFGNRVTFLGALDPTALAALYSASDVFVWPAVNEAIGMAIVEAQAAGLPAVVGDSGDVRSVCADGETGRIVPLGDTTAFAAAVGKYLDDPALRTRQGGAARQRALREHDIAAASRRLDGWLRDAVTAHRGGKP